MTDALIVTVTNRENATAPCIVFRTILVAAAPMVATHGDPSVAPMMYSMSSAAPRFKWFRVATSKCLS